MSKDKSEYPQEHLSSKDEFMKISDYSEGKSSNHNNSDVDQYPFEELENVLSPDVAPRNKQAIYRQKIGQLQQKCARLFKTASFLTRRIQDLQIDSVEQTEAELDANSVNYFLENIQEELQKYKKDLTLYRQKQQLTISSQRKQIQDLNAVLQSLQKEKESLQQALDDLQDSNAELKNTNAQLLDDVSLLQAELRELKSSKNYHRNHKSYSRTTFDDEIQAELQTMIEQLMVELQNQRHSNKRAVTEMKRMQQQIIDLQRQIVAKNNKIYSLQMRELRLNRGLPRVQFANEKIASPSNQKSINYKSKAQRKIGRKDITLEELLSEDREVSEKERYIVASKLLSFYIKKFESEDYAPLHADQLLVSNYSQTHPALIAIKKPLNVPPYSGELSPKILSWNLSVLLSKLLIEPTYESEYSDQNVKILTEAIDQFIEEQYPTFESCSSLKKLIDEMAKSLK